MILGTMLPNLVVDFETLSWVHPSDFQTPQGGQVNEVLSGHIPNSTFGGPALRLINSQSTR